MNKVGIIICLVIMGVICALSGCSSRKDRRNEELVAAYPEEIKAYLKEKYGREFCVNSKWKGVGGSPIPFAESYSPYSYIAWEDEEDGYAFWTKVYPVSLDDKSVVEIRDSYCWKFISRKIRDELSEEWKEITEEECKIIIFTRTDISFGKNINENCEIKDALEDVKPDTYIKFYIILLPSLELSETELKLKTEEMANEFINKYVQSSQWMIEVRVYETYTEEDFLKIEPEKTEQYWFNTKESNYEEAEVLPVKLKPITNIEVKLK